MAGLYLIGFAAPAFEQSACHVGETIDPKRNVPRAIFASAGIASLYFIVLPLVWLGTLGPGALGRELALQLGPTFAPLLGGAAKGAAIWFMIFNMLHGTIAPLAGAARTFSQLAEDGLLPEFMAKRSRTDAPWVATLMTAGMAIVFLFIGDPVWLIAAANLTYLIGISMPNVAVWLLRRDAPEKARPYRAPRGTIALGLFAAGAWALTTVLGFQQFGLPTVLAGIAFAYSGSALYAWRKISDRRKAGLPMIGRTLHLKLSGTMLSVLALDAAGYLMAVSHVTPNYQVLDRRARRYFRGRRALDDQRRPDSAGNDHPIGGRSFQSGGKIGQRERSPISRARCARSRRVTWRRPRRIFLRTGHRPFA